MNTTKGCWWTVSWKLPIFILLSIKMKYNMKKNHFFLFSMWVGKKWFIYVTSSGGDDWTDYISRCLEFMTPIMSRKRTWMITAYQKKRSWNFMNSRQFKNVARLISPPGWRHINNSFCPIHIENKKHYYKHSGPSPSAPTKEKKRRVLHSTL